MAGKKRAASNNSGKVSGSKSRSNLSASLRPHVPASPLHPLWGHHGQQVGLGNDAACGPDAERILAFPIECESDVCSSHAAPGNRVCCRRECQGRRSHHCRCGRGRASCRRTGRTYYVACARGAMKSDALNGMDSLLSTVQMPQEFPSELSPSASLAPLMPLSLRSQSSLIHDRNCVKSWSNFARARSSKSATQPLINRITAPHVILNNACL